LDVAGRGNASRASAVTATLIITTSVSEKLMAREREKL